MPNSQITTFKNDFESDLRFLINNKKKYMFLLNL